MQSIVLLLGRRARIGRTRPRNIRHQCHVHHMVPPFQRGQRRVGGVKLHATEQAWLNANVE